MKLSCLWFKKTWHRELTRDVFTHRSCTRSPTMPWAWCLPPSQALLTSTPRPRWTTKELSAWGSSMKSSLTLMRWDCRFSSVPTSASDKHFKHAEDRLWCQHLLFFMKSRSLHSGLIRSQKQRAHSHTCTGYQQALISDRNAPAQEINTTDTKACGFHWYEPRY